MNISTNRVSGTLFLLFFCVSLLSAQKFSVGATVGLLSSQFDGDRLFGYNKQGLIGGLNWYYTINKKNVIQFDIDYLNIGSNYANETRPPLIDRTKYTLLSIDVHASSLFVGYGYNFKEFEKNRYILKITGGMRISRAFIFDTFSHNIGEELYTFEKENLSTTFVGPEGRFGVNVLDNLTINVVSYIAINNMVVNTNVNIDTLRPFYFGVTTSYVIVNGKKKRRRR